jgi:hypothetical protein
MSVELVTADTLQKWVSPERTLHPAYEFLSSTHRSDYLRSYFMDYFGGGYSDIKPLRWNWLPYADALENEPQRIAFYGSPEQSPQSVAGNASLQKQWSLIVSNCAFLFRPRTDFAFAWRERVHQVLDAHFDAIREHPGTYHPRAVASGIHSYGWLDIRRSPRGYPLRWAQIQGEVFHKLQAEQFDSFKAALPPLEFGRYR